MSFFTTTSRERHLCLNIVKWGLWNRGIYRRLNAVVGGYCAARRGYGYSVLEYSRLTGVAGLTALTDQRIRQSVRMIELADRSIHQSAPPSRPLTKATGLMGCAD